MSTVDEAMDVQPALLEVERRWRALLHRLQVQWPVTTHQPVLTGDIAAKLTLSALSISFCSWTNMPAIPNQNPSLLNELKELTRLAKEVGQPITPMSTSQAKLSTHVRAKLPLYK